MHAQVGLCKLVAIACLWIGWIARAAGTGDGGGGFAFGWSVLVLLMLMAVIIIYGMKGVHAMAQASPAGYGPEYCTLLVDVL